MPGPGKPFEKGWKGGSGRPKGSLRIQICKDFAEKEGFQKLIDIASGKAYRVGTLNGKVVELGPSQELQFEALKLTLAYGVGKPTEFIDVSSGGQSIADWAHQWFGGQSSNGHATNGTATNGNGHNGNGSGGLHSVSGKDNP